MKVDFREAIGRALNEAKLGHAALPRRRGSAGLLAVTRTAQLHKTACPSSRKRELLKARRSVCIPPIEVLRSSKRCHTCPQQRRNALGFADRWWWFPGAQIGAKSKFLVDGLPREMDAL